MSLIEHLRQLFLVDSQVRGLQSRLDSARLYLNGQQRKLDALLEQQRELQTRQRQFRAKVANLETEIAAIDERVAKLKADLNRATTDKQYAALLTELNTLKTQKSQLESQALEEMERIEGVESGLAEIENSINAAATLRDLARKQFDERNAEVGERLEELKREREVAAASVPTTERAVFDALADQYDGEALASVEILDRRRHEYACSSCNMHLPLDVVSVLLIGQSVLTRCPACHRILFMQEATRGAFAKK